MAAILVFDFFFCVCQLNGLGSDGAQNLHKVNGTVFKSLLNQLREPLIERNYKKQNEVADQLAKQYGYRMHDNIIHFTVSPLFDLAFKADGLGITSYRSTTVCNEYFIFGL
ncbi:hypothetical protein AABB24_028726 [Solanum stoloniferum]|uniref:RNase H type-1 domain-containing protein n=1 Tax=Solanum stoloniferum TaxID=62892 RepID=A0ABD2SA91_9SOLN